MNKNHKAHQRLSRELYDNYFNYSPSLELFTERGDSPVSRIILPDKYPEDGRLSPSSRVIPDEPPSPGLSSTSTASLFIMGPVPHPAEGVDNAAEDAGRDKNKTPSSVVPNASYSIMSEPMPRYAKTSGTIIHTHSRSRFPMPLQIPPFLKYVHPQRARRVHRLRNSGVACSLTFGVFYYFKCESLCSSVAVLFFI
jgi:hypothetical protein